MAHIEQISQELTWRIRRDVLYPGQPLEKIRLPEDDDGTHLGLFDDNKLINRKINDFRNKINHLAKNTDNENEIPSRKEIRILKN
jgi:hypothetical protein